MRKRPVSLIILASFLMGCAVAIPLQISYLYGISFINPLAMFHYISLPNWLFISFCLLNAYLLFEASDWVKWTLPVLLVITLWNNWFVSQFGQDYDEATTLVASALFIFVHGLIFHRSALKVLRDPSNRWWRIPQRKQIPVEVVLTKMGGQKVSLECYDISEGGTFLPHENLMKANSNKSEKRKKVKLDVGDHVQVKLKLSQLHRVTCYARVVREAPAKGNYPGGYGLSFDAMEKDKQKILRSFIQKTPEMGNIWSTALV